MSRGPVAILILSRTSGVLSYRFNYSKQVDATNSTISLAAYRFSDRHFQATPTIWITNTTTAMRRTKNRRSAYPWANRLPH
ncbi:fimbria/pilus outer membrane usher protein [Escherichia coli]